MESSYQDCIAKLVDLILKKQATHYQISLDLRQSLIEKSGSRRLRVLYNKTYGGFDYSREFSLFCKKSGVGEEDREKDVDQVLAFGKSLIEKYPILSDIFKWYAQYGKEYKKASNDAERRRDNIDKRDQFDALTAKVQEQIASGPIGFIDEAKDEAPADVWPFVRSYWNTYPRNSLYGFSEKALQKLLDEAQAQRQKLDDLIGEASPSIDIIQAVQAAEAVKAEETVTETRDSGKLEDLWVKPNKFLKALEAYGPESAKTWASQAVISVAAVLYFLAHQDVFERSYDAASDLAAQETLGLLAASGAHCELAIDNVPIYAQYSISEYDGKERVYLL